MWVTVDCHQFLTKEGFGNRMVFEPIEGRLINVVLNNLYGTRILIPEKNQLPRIEDIREIYKHKMCKYLDSNLTIISVSYNTNNLGKFCSMHFRIESVHYKISDVQYVT